MAPKNLAAEAKLSCKNLVFSASTKNIAASRYVYPTLDELADTIGHVVSHFKWIETFVQKSCRKKIDCIVAFIFSLKSFVGFGVGAGANIFCRYAMKYPKIVDALILVNCTSTAAGWIEWGYEKLNVYYLRSRGMTTLTVDYLMWHHFGRNLDQYNFDLVNSYKQYFSHLPNPKNLAGFIESYIRCPVLQIVGSGSPHVNDSVDFNGRLDPSKSNWLKVSDCSGLVLEEKPDKSYFGPRLSLAPNVIDANKRLPNLQDH
uniref:Uncharacterized protein n=1 Tax=Romanomermis culicivorax TaxID=13658 RepID=A0A915IIE7_ROMCU